MKTLSFAFLIQLIFMNLIFSQEFQIVHPTRQIDFTSNGYANNGSKLYISTVFDGHIYEFDFNNTSNGLVDRFRIYDDIQNFPCNGSIIYLNDKDILYAGTTWGNIVYIFYNVDKYTAKGFTKILPHEAITIENEDVGYLYRPHRSGNYIYWGCYHSEKNGPAKIIKFDISSETYSVIKFTGVETANYTHSLTIIGNYLYAGTENGHIVKYNISTGNVDSNVIDLGDDDKVYYMTNDGANIFTMINRGTFPLFKIENPSTALPTITNITLSGYNYSRIYYNSGHLYGTNWDYNISSDTMSVTSYGIGLFCGLSYGGNNYLIGIKNVKIGGVKKKEIKKVLIPSGTSNVYNPTDITDDEIGAKLQTLATANDDKLYMSTYWVGSMYTFDTSTGIDDLVPTSPANSHNQADIIKPFNNYVLFGCYGGERDANLNIFNYSSSVWNKIEIDNDNTTNEYLSRITSIAIDPSTSKIFVGSGEQTNNSLTKDAVLRYLQNPTDTSFDNINYSKSYLENPIRFVSLAYYSNHLYGVSYNRDYEYYFFKLNVSNSSNPIFSSKLALGEIEMYKGFRDKILLREGSKLLCGFGKEFRVYDLTNFQISNPDKTLNFTESIGEIVADDDYYYMCFTKHIKIYTKNNYKFIKSIYIDNSNNYDKIQSISVLDDKLYAVTLLGRFYEFDTVNYKRYCDVLFWNKSIPSNIWVEKSTGSSFTSSGSASLWKEAWGSPTYELRTGDFNGDGMEDILFWNNSTSSKLYVEISTGSSFTSSGSASLWKENFGVPGQDLKIGDFNGDGMDDILFWNKSTPSNLYVETSTGSSFASSGSASLWKSGWGAPSYELRVGDFNGDGKDDVLFWNNSTPSNLWVETSTGSSFTSSGSASLWKSGWGAPTFDLKIGDFSGDGKDDAMFWNNASPSKLWVEKSTGSSFTSSGSGSLWKENFGAPGYDLKVGDFNGAEDLSSSLPKMTVSPIVDETLAKEFVLYQNFPNPFNPTTTIKYFVAEPISVNLEVFNILGQKIKTLIDETQSKGTYQIQWNGQDQNHNFVTSGIYIYRLKVGSFTQTKKCYF